MAKYKLVRGKYIDSKGKKYSAGEEVELTEAAAKNFADLVQKVLEKEVKEELTTSSTVIPKSNNVQKSDVKK